jgi:hypothetical protein
MVAVSVKIALNMEKRVMRAECMVFLMRNLVVRMVTTEFQTVNIRIKINYGVDTRGKKK